MLGEEIISRAKRLESDRDVVKEQWDVIERYIAPYRGRFYYDNDNESSQEWRKPYIYDGTAIQASQNLSASLHSALTSPTTRFFAMNFRDDKFKNDKDAQVWLEKCSDIVYWSLQDSNFNVQINETYQDLVNFGTSILLEESVNDGKDLVFKSVPIKECFFEEDDKDGVANFYRVYEWTPKQMVSFFGKDGVPEEIWEEATNASTDTQKKYKIIYCIYSRLDKLENKNSINVLSPDNRPFGWKYVLYNDGTDLGESGGFYEMPAFVPRWLKTNGSMWGNSPAMVAISDVLTLNRLMELNLIAIEKVIDPPTITTQRGLIGNLNLKAGGVTVVRDINDMKPYESGARFDVTYAEQERLREAIKDYFFINQLILPPMQGTPATATEISVRMQQLERLIGPTLGRLQTDVLDPMITRSFRIKLRAGQLPEMPESIKNSGAELDIEYTSPMAKTQEASNVAAIERYIMFVAQTSQFSQEALDIPDLDVLLRKAGEGMGIPASGFNSIDQVESSRADRKRQQEMMAEGAAMEQLGKGMEAMGGGNESV